MKLTMELQGHAAGESPNSKKPGETINWTAVWGTDTNGRYARAITYGPVATALNARINGALDSGEVLAGKRLVVTMTGEWKTRPAVKDGKEVQQRSFWAGEFEVLDGMELEAARLRRDAMSALEKAEKLRKAGQFALAYEAVAQFVANYAGVPIDLEQFLADNAADDAEFGAAAVADADPEAAAAAYFAREDRKRDAAPAAAPEAPAETAPAGEASDDTVQDEPMEFGPDEVIGAGEPPADLAEEDAIELAEAAPAAEERDVLDDDGAQERAAPAGRAAPFGNVPVTRPGFAAPAAQASRPFAKPDLPRQAPQPSARPAPQAQAPAGGPPIMSRRPSF